MRLSVSRCVLQWMRSLSASLTDQSQAPMLSLVFSCRPLPHSSLHLTTVKPPLHSSRSQTLTHTHTFNGPLSRTIPGWAGTRKVKPIWIIVKQETVSGSGISWAICKSAPRSRQITMPATHRSVFYRPDALPAAQPTASKHWRQRSAATNNKRQRKNTGPFYKISYDLSYG